MKVTLTAVLIQSQKVTQKVTQKVNQKGTQFSSFYDPVIALIASLQSMAIFKFLGAQK